MSAVYFGRLYLSRMSGVYVCRLIMSVVISVVYICWKEGEGEEEERTFNLKLTS